ncbi:hypothetical protein EVA_11867 [gut metagenome]|uniref:Uncharacterized protein n=1 Tax=gut metagenome TaxID=749906 RepID=J9GK69_9ZZZZ
MTEEIFSRSDQLVVVITEDKECPCTFRLRNTGRALLDHFGNRTGFFINEFSLAFLIRPQFGETLHPFVMCADNVVMPFGRADAKGG